MSWNLVKWKINRRVKSMSDRVKTMMVDTEEEGGFGRDKSTELRPMSMLGQMVSVVGLFALFCISAYIARSTEYGSLSLILIIGGGLAWIYITGVWCRKEQNIPDDEYDNHEGVCSGWNA